MAVAQFYQWESLGRPLEPCRPIRDYVERLKAAFPQDAASFSWYANETHYQANPPEDHTPYSYTGWPQQSPHWVVFATDVMHHPSKGVNCDELFPYWLSEAKAGRTPWVKYLIWQAKLYDVRNSWAPRNNSGHFDHVHISCRTDHRNTSLGGWSIVPGKGSGDDMVKTFLWNGNYYVSKGDASFRETIPDGASMNVLRDAYPGCQYPGADSNGFPTPDLNTRGWTEALVNITFGKIGGTGAPVTFPPELVDDLATAVAEAVNVPTADDNATATANEIHDRMAG
jgi:hypothetical protein